MTRAPDVTVLSVDASTTATGVALWLVSPDVPVRSSLLRWAVLVPPRPAADNSYHLSSARSQWMVLRAEAWCISRHGNLPHEVVCEERIGHFASMAPEIDALVRDFRKQAARWRASWYTYAPVSWRSGVGGKDKRETADYLTRFLDWSQLDPPPVTELGLNAWDAIGIGLHYLSERRFGQLGTKKKKERPAARTAAGDRPAWIRRTSYRRTE